MTVNRSSAVTVVARATLGDNAYPVVDELTRSSRVARRVLYCPQPAGPSRSGESTIQVMCAGEI